MISRLALPFRSKFLENIKNARIIKRAYDSVDVQNAMVARMPFKGILSPSFVSDADFKDSANVIPIFQRMNLKGALVGDEGLPFSMDEARKMLDCMLRVEAYDKVLHEIQRQGRISFYMQNEGEEAAQIGSAAALHPQDVLFLQYREMGVLLWRGFTVDDILTQCFALKDDPGKGRQMPVHYTSKKHNLQSISSPLATQTAHAAGAGYAFKCDESDRVAVVYFGDGAASEGDFPTALNFAAALGSQTLFICRNNGYAISTSVESQYKGDGIAARGLAYGVLTARVDGNDLAAVYSATKAARKLVTQKRAPVLLELMTYRLGHHSTSDDCKSYRLDDEMLAWIDEGVKAIGRMKNFFVGQGAAKFEDFDRVSKAARAEILSSIRIAENTDHAPIDDLFTDVYDSETWNVKEQREDLMYLHKHQKINPDIEVNKFASSASFPTNARDEPSLLERAKLKS